MTNFIFFIYPSLIFSRVLANLKTLNYHSVYQPLQITPPPIHKYKQKPFGNELPTNDRQTFTWRSKAGEKTPSKNNLNVN